MKTKKFSSLWRGSSAQQGAKTKIDSLYQWLDEQNVYVIDRHLDMSSTDTKAVTIHLMGTNDWGIFVDRQKMKNSAEEYCTMLHESGHYATGTTHKVYSPYDLISRHEYRANKWAIRCAVPAEELAAALAAGYTEVWSLAEYFGVTEDFMKRAISWYAHGNFARQYGASSAFL